MKDLREILTLAIDSPTVLSVDEFIEQNKESLENYFTSIDKKENKDHWNTYLEEEAVLCDIEVYGDVITKANLDGGYLNRELTDSELRVINSTDKFREIALERTEDIMLAIAN